MNPDSTLAVTNTCPKDGIHLYPTSILFTIRGIIDAPSILRAS